jgi:DNA-binding beta-propeller fold protein YncE
MWGTLGQGASPQELYGPRAITVDERGRVFVVDTGNKRVMVYDEEGGYLTQVGSAGFEAGQFDEPVGISMTPAGDLVVADTWNRRVQVFRETGQGTFVFDRQWEIAGWAGQSLDNKPYIAAGADGRVWVSDPEGFRVLCFDENGGFLFTWGDFGRDAARFELPVGVAVDDEGNVWIVDTDTSRVLKFTPPVEGS